MSAKRILIVDNEPYIQEVAQISLETTAGWEVITADSGASGIAIAADRQPDAILLDVMMPDMDGITTFKALHSNPSTQAIPVILLTAKVQAADRRRYQDLGIQATIAKPFDPLQLANQIADILNWSIELS
ncbi:MAG: response regulator [Leptolyngbya sp. SIO4C1]|nr:response regulator [Leptolyngbya sp. SIO4C1]